MQIRKLYLVFCLLLISCSNSNTVRITRIAEEKTRIVFIGDSIFYGHNGIDFYISNNFKNYECSNFSIPGSDSTSLSWRIYPVLEYKPDYVCIMIGINDFGYYKNSVDTYINNIKSFINSCIYDNKSIKIILCSILPITEKSVYIKEINNTKIYEINLLLKDIEKNLQQVEYLDLYKCFIEQEDLNSLYIDGLHPNEKGYGCIIDELEKIL